MRLRTWPAAALLALAAGCGAPQPQPDLLLEYVKAPSVKNDTVGQLRAGGTPGDRLANFASHRRGHLDAVLFRATLCPTNSNCHPIGAASAAIRETVGAPARIFERRILVRRADGEMEMLKLYVVEAPGGAKTVVDTKGQTYGGDLEEFRRHNALLAADDLIRAPRDLAEAPSGDGPIEVVTVSGSTAPVLLPWVLGGTALLVAAGAVVLLLVRRGRRPFAG
ncbi:hypothetical protein M8C13_01815 [Crossiella sp. SN42]|uniref:hypothetical protein n=1 Tax=Crossiella sp. SN42 TaxID=2944808 RepID=UPI00207CE575|nr:hypothetical protein [Crossiella sp. SN42]MCO1574493.1 hypothetical protein [Crossiella sp. SN42]